MTEISFATSKFEHDMISEIATRAYPKLRAAGHDVKKIDIEMDVTAVHLNGNPLRLAELVNADDFNFFHDIGGIRRHLNRETGQLENHFRPRYSAPE
jgi:hypothetical protein